MILIVHLINIGIEQALESIQLNKYIGLFVEHEIDFATFLTLQDADLKELGIKALGSRKKIEQVISKYKLGGIE
jgi:hypothetical protein